MENMLEKSIKVRKRRGMVFWGVCCVGGLVVLVGAAALVPCMSGAKPTAEKNACINNLRKLDGAKEQWSLENKKDKGAAVTMMDVEQYLRELPQCPGRGVYSVALVGEVPKCTLEEGKGHRLPSFFK